MSEFSNKINLLTQNMRELDKISNKLLDEMRNKNKVMELTLSACEHCSQYGGSKKKRENQNKKNPIKWTDCGRKVFCKLK